VATADAAPPAALRVAPPARTAPAAAPAPPARVRSNRPVRRHRIPEPLLLLIVVATALAVAVAADRRLRRLQNLVDLLSRREQPVFVPFSDTLQDRVTVKAQWNQILDNRTAALARGDAQAFADATYALSDFAGAHESAGRELCLPYLLELIQRYGNDPVTIGAYTDLLQRNYLDQTLPDHPAYVQKLLDFAAAQPHGGNPLLGLLASTLQNNDEPALALKVLKHIRASGPVDFDTEASMRQLLAMLGPSDPDAAALTSELAALDARRAHLNGEASWYATFAPSAAKGNLDRLEALRAQVAATPLNAFTASADAQLIQRYLKEGRFQDATRARQRFADYSGADLENAIVFAQSFVPPDDAAHPMSPRKLAAAKAAIIPDSWGVNTERWRALLLAGREADANTLAKQLFAGPMSYLAKPAADLTDAAMGRVSKLSPVLVLHPPQGDVPPEMQDATGVLTASIDLSPNAASTSASIHTHIELWLSSDSFLQIVQAEEPRSPPPAPVVTKHDADPWHDEYVEFFTVPDCWLDFADHWAVTATGVTWDARELVALNPGQSKRKTDKTLELGVKATAARTATGWSLRIVVPRQLLIPPGPTIVRFNARRGRHEMHGTRLINEYYTWAPIPGVDPHLDLMGWLVVPQ
jgi:hypothetical protein